MIPNRYNYIFGMNPNDKPFSFIHYLCIRSCIAVNNPASVTIYYEYEPDGIWWNEIKRLVTTTAVVAPRRIFGRPINRTAHRADVLRLELLIQAGGIYLDVDVLCLKPFKSLLHYDCVLGEEYNEGLCNAVILAQPNTPFLRRWFAEYSSFSDQQWNEHSVRLPRRLADAHPDQLHIEPHTAFYWPMHWPNHLAQFFLSPASCFSERSFCVHLWESKTWPLLRALDINMLHIVDSEFFRLARALFQTDSYGAEDKRGDWSRVTADLGLSSSGEHQQAYTRSPRETRGSEFHQSAIRRLCSLLGLKDEEIVELFGASEDEVRNSVQAASSFEKLMERLDTGANIP
jgi:hypothetical protein